MFRYTLVARNREGLYITQGREELEREREIMSRSSESDRNAGKTRA